MLAQTVVDTSPHGWAYPPVALLADWRELAVAFLIGSIPFGLIVARLFFKTDIRASGSGNIGAANALRTLGRKAGIAVLLLDAAKGVVAVALAWIAVPLLPFTSTPVPIEFAKPDLPLMPLLGLASILGHCYTPWLRFRGGKGVATFLGAAFALSWPSGLAFVAVWLAIVLPTGYASLGSMLGTVVAGAVLIATNGRYGADAFVFAAGSALVVAWKHRENLARLRAGNENRLALLKR